MKSYAKLNDFFIKIQQPDKRNRNLAKDIMMIKQEYASKNYSNYNKITLAFFLAQPFNVVKKIQNKNRYLSVHNPVSDNIYSLPVVRLVRKTKKSKLYNTYLLIDDHTTGNYLLYYNIDINKDTLHLITRIDKSYFNLFPMIYNYNKLNRIASNNILAMDKYIEKIDNYKKLSATQKYPAMISLKQDISALSLLKTTYNDILEDVK